MTTNGQQPSTQDALDMLQRMHGNAAKDSSRAGWHAASAQHEQLAAKYRDAAQGQ